MYILGGTAGAHPELHTPGSNWSYYYDYESYGLFTPRGYGQLYREPSWPICGDGGGLLRPLVLPPSGIMKAPPNKKGPTGAQDGTCHVLGQFL